ncbi:MAG TPA: terminase gpA endonuclease subunit [Planctomycetota bacterium]|nr:terminase gpA endonuclease subunit [Planctomycetota bacterium]
MTTLEFPKTRANLPLLHRRDVWLRVFNGIGFSSLNYRGPLDQSRKERCRWSLFEFLKTYFGHRFFDETEAHKAIIKDIESAVLATGRVPIKQAEAAPRSFGKTTLGELAAIWAAFYRHRDFILFIGSTGPNGEKRLTSIKNEILTNPLLAEDFPEIVAALIEMHGGDPRRAPPDFPWSSDRARLPNGVLIMGRGIDSSIVGLNEFGMRPDFTWIDDVETLDTVRSKSETEKIRQRLELEVLRLHAAHKAAAYFFICTIRARGSISDDLTNAKKNPEWRGRRFKALAKDPERKDLWEKFIEICRGIEKPGELELSAVASTALVLAMPEKEFERLTHEHQAALRFYVSNKEEMDRGAEVLDPIRLPLHALYHARATEGELAFACELQNDPPEDSNRKRLELDEVYLMTRCIGEDLGIVPAWAKYLTASVDVGLYTLHWEVDAWDSALQTSALIAQGQQETNINAGGQYKMTDDVEKKESLVAAAIRNALEALRVKFAEGFPRRSGELITPNLIGVDVGGTAETAAWYEVVWRFCKTARPWVPLKGMSPWKQSTADKNFGRNFMVDPIIGRHDCNVDEYKLRVARAYEAPLKDDKGEMFTGARILHRDTPKVYCKHQTAEFWVEAISEDAPAAKAIKVGWNRDGTKPNHWWDTAWMAYALADIFATRHNLAAGRRAVKYGVVGQAWK